MPRPPLPPSGKTDTSNRTTMWLAAAIFIGVFLAAIGIQPRTTNTASAHAVAPQAFLSEPVATAPEPLLKPTRATVKSKPKPVVRANPPKNCAEARRRGIAPMYVGEPEYGEWMDGDGDGIACEPYHGR